MMPFWIALQFLSTLPVQLKRMPTPKENAQSLLFYPIIGLLMGLVLFGIVTLLHALPMILLTVMVSVLWIWMSGGLHLDGLADTADAWVGGFGDAERTLNIMKDPSCGPIGVLSLIMVCMIKFVSVYIILQQQQSLALILFPILGRLCPLFLFLSTNYVRQKGLGTAMGEHLPKMWASIMIIAGLLMCLIFSWVGIFTAMIAMFSLVYLRHKFIQRIGGITGDTVGASIEIIEAVSIFSFACVLFY
ncbi:adenosylcobinamide-GDP ribazoletransferase [Acinetobacter lanii]|uniref:Adenosylcobinamide-GDP ribazoletransferase n=1 Tax=Acinetobacter lanii TaxID=2715163 RepID=A0A6G8S4S9_9GAMM|nr:adenosylcobinamide-GDP ribazoletransferase [Acinetobacter lanii]QIO09134.1 adenosylcobinamide-GDP ribazoletransferase [Acinetobacter lanii]